jgi:hypothetical protein
MKIDFIHIGYHKTASTFLQSRVFPLVDNLVVLNGMNQKVDKWFYDNFVNVNSHDFDKDRFVCEFSEIVSRVEGYDAEKSITAVSDENISGDIYTGLESRELMSRVHEVFGAPYVLIVIRNQIDYILSAYSNYVIHGGTKRIGEWLYGQETRFGLIIKKLMYSYLVAEYMQFFGKEKVYVIQYEKLFDPVEGIGSFLSLFDLSLPEFKQQRVNPGRSLSGNSILRVLNRIGLSKLRGRQRFVAFLKGAERDRQYVYSLLEDDLRYIKNDNLRLESLAGIKLADSYLK